MWEYNGIQAKKSEVGSTWIIWRRVCSKSHSQAKSSNKLYFDLSRDQHVESLNLSWNRKKSDIWHRIYLFFKYYDGRVSQSLWLCEVALCLTHSLSVSQQRRHTCADKWCWHAKSYAWGSDTSNGWEQSKTGGFTDRVMCGFIQFIFLILNFCHKNLKPCACSWSAKIHMKKEMIYPKIVS